jgi:hypothetical protein
MTKMGSTIDAKHVYQRIISIVQFASKVAIYLQRKSAEKTQIKIPAEKCFTGNLHFCMQSLQNLHAIVACKAKGLFSINIAIANT